MSDKPTDFPQPLGGNEMPRFAGPGTMMRLPAVDSAAGMDAVFIGIPLDIGTSNRSGTRFGPKQIRAESVLMRPYNMWTRAAPFDSLRVGDLGDVPINTFDLKDSVARITAFYNEVLAHDVVPLTLGGDHTLTLPVLRAVATKHGPVGLIHVDAHADINDHMFGEKIAHGTPFRRAVEEGLIDPHRTWQIGLRGTGYTAEDFDWARDRGFTVVQAEELWHRSATPLSEQARAARVDEARDRALHQLLAPRGLDLRGGARRLGRGLGRARARLGARALVVQDRVRARGVVVVVARLPQRGLVIRNGNAARG